MDTDETIRRLNTITAEHFTSGGRHMPSGDRAFDGFILAAWYTRNALDSHCPPSQRMCHLLRAKEEIAYPLLSESRREHFKPLIPDMLNAISWATSLVCDEIRKLEASKPRTPRAQ